MVRNSSPGSMPQTSASLTLPAQPVDATPCGINFLFKVVFMAQEKRAGLSATQKSDMWSRWRAGQSLREIGRAFGEMSGYATHQDLMHRTNNRASLFAS